MIYTYCIRGVSRNALYKCTMLTFLLTYCLTVKFFLLHLLCQVGQKYELLNCDKHKALAKKLKKDISMCRPDIVHQVESIVCLRCILHICRLAVWQGLHTVGLVIPPTSEDFLVPATTVWITLIAQFASTINSNVCPHIRVPNTLMRESYAWRILPFSQNLARCSCEVWRL